MPVPSFQVFMMPVLKLVSDGQEHSVASVRDPRPDAMHLSEEEIGERLPSGATKAARRSHWAVVYLAKAGALTRTKRGHVAITDRGRQLSAAGLPQITIKALERFPEFREFYRPHRNDEDSSGAESSVAFREEEQTPEEKLERSYQKYRQALASEILETVRKTTPRFFESLVVKLLIGMGYGGSDEGAGELTGRSGDEGIDGTIHQDKLGLDTVYIQAKKWSDTVGRPVVQAFAGSLHGHAANKGVLITTSTFSQDAREFVRRLPIKIVLIDGKRLAELMIGHDVGVAVTKEYQIKRLDQDFLKANEGCTLLRRMRIRQSSSGGEKQTVAFRNDHRLATTVVHIVSWMRRI